MKRSGLRYTAALSRVRAGIAAELDDWDCADALGAPQGVVMDAVLESMVSADRALT